MNNGPIPLQHFFGVIKADKCGCYVSSESSLQTPDIVAAGRTFGQNARNKNRSWRVDIPQCSKSTKDLIPCNIQLTRGRSRSQFYRLYYFHFSFLD